MHMPSLVAASLVEIEKVRSKVRVRERLTNVRKQMQSRRTKQIEEIEIKTDRVAIAATVSVIGSGARQGTALDVDR